MTLIETIRLVMGDEKGAHLFGNCVIGLDCTLQNRGVGKVELKTIFFEKLASLLCLLNTLCGQVNIVPACESVLEVPGGLSVAHKDNFVEGLGSDSHFKFKLFISLLGHHKVQPTISIISIPFGLAHLI